MGQRNAEILAEYGVNHEDLGNGFVFVYADVEPDDESQIVVFNVNTQKFGDEFDKSVWERVQEPFVPVSAFGGLYGKPGFFVEV